MWRDGGQLSFLVRPNPRISNEIVVARSRVPSGSLCRPVSSISRSSRLASFARLTFSTSPPLVYKSPLRNGHESIFNCNIIVGIHTSCVSAHPCACAGSRRQVEVRFGQQEGWMIDRRRLLPVCILKRQRVLYGSSLHPDPSLAVLMHVLRGDIGALLAKPVDQAVFGLLRYFGPLDPVDGKTRVAKPFEMENEPLDRLPCLVAHRSVKNDGPDLFFEIGRFPSRPWQKVSEKLDKEIVRGLVEPIAARGGCDFDHLLDESRLRFDAPFVDEGGKTPSAAKELLGHDRRGISREQGIEMCLPFVQDLIGPSIPI